MSTNQKQQKLIVTLVTEGYKYSIPDTSIKDAYEIILNMLGNFDHVVEPFRTKQLELELNILQDEDDQYAIVRITTANDLVLQYLRAKFKSEKFCDEMIAIKKDFITGHTIQSAVNRVTGKYVEQYIGIDLWGHILDVLL